MVSTYSQQKIQSNGLKFKVYRPIKIIQINVSNVNMRDKCKTYISWVGWLGHG